MIFSLIAPQHYSHYWPYSDVRFVGGVAAIWRARVLSAVGPIAAISLLVRAGSGLVPLSWQLRRPSLLERAW
jgi:hypothetical protein